MIGYIIFGLLLVAVGVLLFSPWLKGYRTVVAGWLATVMGAVLPVLTQIVGYLQELDWRQYVLGADRKNLIVLGIVGGLGVVMIVLRHMTSGKVGEK